MAYIAAEALNPLHINALGGHVLEPRVLRKSLDPKNVSELVDCWLDLTRFHKSDEKHHNDTKRIWSKLERGYVEVLENGLNERMQGKRNSSLYNRLAEGHVARRGEVRSIGRTGFKDRFP